MTYGGDLSEASELIDVGGEPPAGWVYVASHPLAGANYTKIGYSKWHPIKPCFKYPSGFKRLHHLEFSLRAFGLGGLTKWSSEYHLDARVIEGRLRKALQSCQRKDVGTSREIFDIPHAEAVSLVRSFIPGEGSGIEG